MLSADAVCCLLMLSAVCCLLMLVLWQGDGPNEVEQYIQSNPIDDKEKAGFVFQVMPVYLYRP